MQNHKYQQKKNISGKTNNLQSNNIIYTISLKLTRAFSLILKLHIMNLSLYLEIMFLLKYLLALFMKSS